MRLLLVTPFLPHAHAAHGGAVYLNVLADALGRHADVGLVTFATPSELRAVEHLPAPLARSWIVVRPERADQSAVARVAHKLRMLRAWTAGGLPITVAKFRSAVMRNVLAHASARFRPDAALFEMDLLAQYLPVLDGVPTVLTDHEGADPVPGTLGPGRLGEARDLRLWTRYVATSYPRAALLQALTAEDATRLSDRLGRPVGVRPPLVRIPTRAVSPADAPPRILFFGDYSHRPNPEAARFVATELLPRLRSRCPNAELWLAGANATSEVTALGAREGVRALGFVADLPELLGSVRALVAPVFSGGGSRIKVLTALAHGLPVVGNALALRGIDAPSVAARCAETAEELAASAAILLDDRGAAAEAGRAARSWAERAIAPDAIAEAQLAAIETLLGRG